MALYLQNQNYCNGVCDMWLLQNLLNLGIVLFSLWRNTGNVLTELSSVQHCIFMWPLNIVGIQEDRAQIIDVYAYWKMEI